LNEGQYYGYFRNFSSLQWWKLDDEDVEEVRDDDVLDDAYAGDSCAFMLQYVLQDSDSYCLSNYDFIPHNYGLRNVVTRDQMSYMKIFKSLVTMYRQRKLVN
jgi:hypothetical protein